MISELISCRPIVKILIYHFITSILVTHPFSEISRKFPGNFRNISGNFPENSNKFPRIFPIFISIPPNLGTHPYIPVPTPYCTPTGTGTHSFLKSIRENSNLQGALNRGYRMHKFIEMQSQMYYCIHVPVKYYLILQIIVRNIFKYFFFVNLLIKPSNYLNFIENITTI